MIWTFSPFLKGRSTFLSQLIPPGSNPGQLLIQPFFLPHSQHVLQTGSPRPWQFFYPEGPPWHMILSLAYREPSLPKSSYPHLLTLLDSLPWTELQAHTRTEFSTFHGHGDFNLWAFLKGHQLFIPISFFWPLLAASSLLDSLWCKQPIYDHSCSSKQHINMA